MINQFDVVPEPETRKKQEWLVVTLLALVFCGLLGGYIYYGIYLAKQTDMNEFTPTTDTSTGLSAEERDKIIKELESEAVPLPVSDREIIMEALEAEAEPLSPAEREKALESLQNNTDVPLE